jgi:parvulin-like peptidyl-prolyl isomerase
MVIGYLLWRIDLRLYPPPAPSVGPLSEARVEALRTQWVSIARRAPSTEQMQNLVAAELDREMLYREALSRNFHLFDTVVEQRLIRNMRFLRLGEEQDDKTIYQEALKLELHLGDEVVKRRLQQLMETVLLAQAKIKAPDEAEILERFSAQREALRVAARYSFQHLYLPREREQETEALLVRLRAESMAPARARQFSSPFLPGLGFNGQNLGQVARNFGAAFSEGLGQLEPVEGQWLGPLASVYGKHLVWIDKYVPARDAELAEVRQKLERELVDENRRAALARQMELLRQTYEVRM